MALEDQIGVIVAVLLALFGAFKAILDSRKNTAAVQVLEVGHAANAGAIAALSTGDGPSVDLMVLPTQQTGDSPFKVTFHVKASPDEGTDQAVAVKVDFADGSGATVPLVNGYADISHEYSFAMPAGGKSGSREFIPAFKAFNAAGKLAIATAHVYAYDPNYPGPHT
jgi:hypothetical protein